MFEFFRKDEIGEPPWEYNFLVNLPNGLYPLYLKKIFKYRTGEDLPIKKIDKNQWIIDKNKCKTFNQKIQWLKLYDATDLKRDLTDKVKSRDYVKEKIGEEYLKPVLQICNSFDEIDFNKLPNAFVMKCNHGSKWQYIIKDKEVYLNTPYLFELTKRQMMGWLEQEFWMWEGFEMQYEGITPQILIEPLLRDNQKSICSAAHAYCFNSNTNYVIKLHNNKEITIYDKNLNTCNDIFGFTEEKINIEADNLLKQIFILSNELSSVFNFKFVRIDWMFFEDKSYFEEFTFTPYSGFNWNIEKENNVKLGKLIKL